ncbi:MAG: hypothetical protein R2692_07210 [Microbacterium sp.]
MTAAEALEAFPDLRFNLDVKVPPRRRSRSGASSPRTLIACC